MQNKDHSYFVTRRLSEVNIENAFVKTERAVAKAFVTSNAKARQRSQGTEEAREVAFGGADDGADGVRC